jgi:hypothetical protein
MPPAADTLYLSTDYGDHLKPILRGLDTGEIDFSPCPHAAALQRQRSILHWMSDIAADPFDPDRVLVNSGTGVFVNAQPDGRASRPLRTLCAPCAGLEETVHLNCTSPPWAR